MSNNLKKCGNCLLPETYETLVIEEDGNSCNMCQTSKFKQTEINWDRRKKMLDKVPSKNKTVDINEKSTLDWRGFCFIFIGSYITADITAESR